jgi:histidyl-tRNA synthetase
LTQLPARAAPAPAAPQKEKNELDPDEDEEVDESQVGVGSIAAAIGGGYDGLAPVFTAAAAGDGKKAASLPCVGLSIGLDRIFAFLLPKWSSSNPEPISRAEARRTYAFLCA